MAQDSGRGCLKWGCMGCAALVLVPLLVVAGVVAIGLLGGAREPDPQELVRTHELPGVPSSELAPEALELDEGTDAAAPTPGPEGRLVLDVRLARLTLEPGPPGSELRLEADIDRNSVELDERLETGPDGSWTYRLTCRPVRGLLGRLTVGDDDLNPITLVVPRGQPLAVEGRVSTGESRLDLGGLWLTGVSLKATAGSHWIRFSTPVHEPMDELRVDGSAGEVRVLRVGNASPARTVVEHSAGALDVDLTGAWQRDARVEVAFKFGECRVTTPEDARVVVERAVVRMGEPDLRGLPEGGELPADAPVVTLDLEGTGGALRVR